MLEPRSQVRAYTVRSTFPLIHPPARRDPPLAQDPLDVRLVSTHTNEIASRQSRASSLSRFTRSRRLPASSALGIPAERAGYRAAARAVGLGNDRLNSGLLDVHLVG